MEKTVVALELLMRFIDEDENDLFAMLQADEIAVLEDLIENLEWFVTICLPIVLLGIPAILVYMRARRAEVRLQSAA